MVLISSLELSAFCHGAALVLAVGRQRKVAGSGSGNRKQSVLHGRWRVKGVSERERERERVSKERSLRECRDEMIESTEDGWRSG